MSPDKKKMHLFQLAGQDNPPVRLPARQTGVPRSRPDVSPLLLQVCSCMPTPLNVPLSLKLH